MADRIALVTVEHEFRLRRSSGSEIEQQWIVDLCVAVRTETGRSGISFFKWNPAGDLMADHNARVIARYFGELYRGIRTSNDVSNPAAGKSVVEVGRRQQCSCRDDHGTKLHRRQ